MKQTKHCGLSQWELTDRVQMRDFNANNVKVDSLLSKLTFFASRLALAEVERNKRAFFPGIAVNEQFLFPDRITCSEGVTIQNGTATLTGPQTGVLNSGTYYLLDREFSQAVMWVEHSGGVISAALNNVPGQPVRSFFSMDSMSYGTYQELFWPALTPGSDLSVTLNLDRGTNEKMDVFNFSVILF